MVKIATAVLALALLWGCEIPDIETPCSEVTCSGHGDCHVVQEPAGERARCQCDTGFMTTPDGLDCYELVRPPEDGGPDGAAGG